MDIETDYNRAMKSLHVPFIQAVAERIMQSEGDTRRYWDLKNRLYNIQHLPERIEQIQQEITQP